MLLLYYIQRVVGYIYRRVDKTELASICPCWLVFLVAFPCFLSTLFVTGGVQHVGSQNSENDERYKEEWKVDCKVLIPSLPGLLWQFDFTFVPKRGFWCGRFLIVFYLLLRCSIQSFVFSFYAITQF